MSDPRRRDPRSRFMMAIGIPMMALLGGAALVWSVSRILLAADEAISPIIGILFALNILTAAALAATFPRRKGIVMALIVAVAVPVGAAGIVGAVVGERPIESEIEAEEGEGEEEAAAEGEEAPAADEEAPAEGEEAPAAGEEAAAEGAADVDIGAENISFDIGTFELPAEAEVTIVFENRDEGIPHNVAIYTDDTATEEIFVGEIFPGTETMDYMFTAPAAGTYFFRCDVHPTQMTGTVTVG